MKPAVISASDQLAAHLDQAVRWSCLLLLLQIGGVLLVTLVVVVAGMACLDWWLLPERVWLGGTCVWLTVASIGGLYMRHLGLPAGWPTRISVAQQWECSCPHLGSRISSAVGFLTKSKVEQRPESVECEQPNTKDFAALAIEHAAELVQQLPNNTRQPAVMVPVLWALAGGLSLAVFFGLLGQVAPSWKQALVRQFPPAVGGWPKPVATKSVGSEPLLAPLTTAEVSQAIRRLLDRFVVLKRQSEQSDRLRKATVIVDELEALATDTHVLVGRLPRDTPAELLRWCEQVLVTAATAAQPQAELAKAVAVGQSAVTLASVSALERQLALQVSRILPQQPGLRRDQLSAEAVARLDRLADVQQRLTTAVAAAAVTLTSAEPRFTLVAEPLPIMLPGLLMRNQLSAARVGLVDAAKMLSTQAAELGLLVPDTAELIADRDSGLLPAVVAVAAVEADLAASSVADPVTRVGVLRGHVADSVADQTQAAELVGSLEQSAAGISVGASGPGATGGMRVSFLSGLPAGPRWRLENAMNGAGRRIAIDQTLPTETVTPFNEYLQRVVPRRGPLDVPSSQSRQALP